MTASPRVVVYSASWCGWCARAKSLLAEHGVAFTEIDAEAEWGASFRDVLERLTGGRTVPQIMIDGRPIGGYENLAALALDDGLAPLRAAPES